MGPTEWTTFQPAKLREKLSKNEPFLQQRCLQPANLLIPEEVWLAKSCRRNKQRFISSVIWERNGHWFAFFQASTNIRLSL
jgi:hypothetical protein